MLRCLLTWGPPLVLTVLMLFGVVIALSLAMSGTVTPFALFLASVCSAAQWGRRRRLER